MTIDSGVRTANGKPLSYTQNLEDYHLSLALGGQATGFYIDMQLRLAHIQHSLNNASDKARALLAEDVSE